MSDDPAKVWNEGPLEVSSFDAKILESLPKKDARVVYEHPAWLVSLCDSGPQMGLRFLLAALLARSPDRKVTISMAELRALHEWIGPSRSITTWENPATGDVDVVLT